MRRYGPVPWIISAEMFPTVIRGRVMSISLIASNAAQVRLPMHKYTRYRYVS